MAIRRLFLALLLGGGPLLAQEREFTGEEIRRLLDAFDRDYGNKGVPEADVVESIQKLRHAYLSLKARGDRRTPGDRKLEEEIVGRIARKGLTAERRPIVNLECARTLGALGDPDGVMPLLSWLGGILNQPSPNPQAVEYGFQAVAWIGPTDGATLDMVLSYATKGRHQDIDVAKAAIQACAQWRELDGETRKRWFDAICAFLEGLPDGGADAARLARHRVVAQAGLDALRELGDGTTTFADPKTARAWFDKNKDRKWQVYVGPRFRKRP